MNKLTTLGLASIVTLAVLPLANAAYMPDYDTTTPTSQAFNGPYLGVSLDFGNLYNEIKYVQPDDPYYLNLKGHQGDHRVGASILGGYGATFDSFYLSGELYARYIPASNPMLEGAWNKIENIKVSKIETSGTYGGAIRAGVVTSPKTIIFASIGAESTKFKIKNKYMYPSAMPPVTYTDKIDKTEVGIVPGVGIETLLSDNVSLRAQYNYAFYGNIKKTFSAPVMHTVKVDPSRGSFSAVVSYLFS